MTQEILDSEGAYAAARLVPAAIRATLDVARRSGVPDDLDLGAVVLAASARSKLTATTALEGPELATASDVALGITVEKVVEEDGAREQHQAHSPVVTDTTVRVDVYLLDELLFLADELVLGGESFHLNA